MNVSSFASRRKDALKGKARCIKLDLVRRSHIRLLSFFFSPSPARVPSIHVSAINFTRKMDPHREIPTDNPCGAVINIEDELIPGRKNCRILPSAPATRFDSSVHDLRRRGMGRRLSSAPSFVVLLHFSAIPRETVAERRRPCAMTERRR